MLPAYTIPLVVVAREVVYGNRIVGGVKRITYAVRVAVATASGWDFDWICEGP